LSEDDDFPGTTTDLSEWAKVVSVAGDVLTLETTIKFDYDVADNAQVRVVNFMENIIIRDGNLDGGTTTSGAGVSVAGFWFEYCYNVLIQNCDVKRFAQYGISLRNSWISRVSNGRYTEMEGYETGGSWGAAYGVSLSDLTTEATISGVYFENVKHGVAHGVSGTIGVPSETNTTHCTFYHCYTGAWDTHADSGTNLRCANSIFDRIEGHGHLFSGSCCQSRGGDIIFTNNTITNSDGNAIYCREECQSWVVMGNSVKETASNGIRSNTTGTVSVTCVGNNINNGGGNACVLDNLEKGATITFILIQPLLMIHHQHIRVHNYGKNL